MPNGQKIAEEVPFGELRLYPLAVGEKTRVELHPASGFDVGEGRGHSFETEVSGGVVGLIVDTRGRPLEISMGTSNRVNLPNRWIKALGVYYERI